MAAVVYVDVLLFINTIITFAVLLSTEKLLKRRSKTMRLIAASLTGSLFSLLLFFGIRGFVFSLAIKIISSLSIARIAFTYTGRKEYVRTTLITVAVSVVYSGMFILFYQLVRPPNMAIVNDVVYFEFNPLVLLGLTALIYLVMTAFQKLFRERIKSTVVSLEFELFGSAHQCIGKIDTGCSLTEPFSGAPVIIVDSSVVSIPEDSEKRVIPYSAVNSSSILYAAKAARVVIDAKPIDKVIYIAVTNLGNPHFQAIINSDIMR